MTRSEIWTICGHRLQLDVTHEQEALGTSAQVCQITEVWKDGQSPPAGYSWDSGIDQTSPEVRGEKTERKLTRPSGVEDTFLPSHWWKCDFLLQSKREVCSLVHLCDACGTQTSKSTLLIAWMHLSV